jgi:quercetin dioxygenase-like cupin family protein
MAHERAPQVADLASFLTDAAGQGPAWSLETEDLDINLIRFDGGRGVPPHLNAEVDVFGVVVEGEGTLEVDGATHPLAPGRAFYIPKGTTRSLRSSGGPFAYVSCHRRRQGLWPA